MTKKKIIDFGQAEKKKGKKKEIVKLIVFMKNLKVVVDFLKKKESLCCKY
jgi:hypothetical protein